MCFVVDVFSIVLTSRYNTRRPTSNHTVTLTVIYYSLLDCGNGFDLKGSTCVCGNWGEGTVWMVIRYRGIRCTHKNKVAGWEVYILSTCECYCWCCLRETNRRPDLFQMNDLRASIYQRHNKTMHSRFITFLAAGRLCTHTGPEWRRSSNFFAYDSVSTTTTLVCRINRHIPLWFVCSSVFN